MGKYDEHIWLELKRGADALERIAKTLEALVPDQDPTPEATPDPNAEAECPHPPELRVSFGRTKGQEDWLCRVCGYRTVPPED
jgi:hypothetical protein